MRMPKLLAALTACACMLACAPALPETAQVALTAEAAASTAQVVYDLNTLSQFKRTMKDIATEYSNARYAGSTYVNGDSSTYYSRPASTKAPYDQGVLTADTLEVMESMTDFYRYLVGVPKLTSHLGGVEKLQYECLDRTFEFNHYISNDSKPADMSDELWEKGFSCTHNILAWGYTPMGAITGWMNEGYSLSSGSFSTFGHRYALINPRYSTISFGYCGSTAVGRDETSSSSRTMTDTAYAFPCPGYMPAELLSASVSGWNLDFDTNKITVSDTSAVVVTVTNLKSGESYECTTANGKLSASSSYVRFAQPSDYNTSTRQYDSNYKVSVTGLTDKATGKTAEIRYEVDFFKVNDYAPSYVKSAGLRFTNIGMYPSLATEDNLKKLAAVLPKKVTVTTETGRTVTIQASGSWKLDMTNKCFTNSAAASQLPSDITDKNNVLKSLKITYTELDDYYGMYSTFSASPRSLKEGETLKFNVHAYLSNCSQSSIYKVTGSNGSYTGTEVYNSATSPEFSTSGSYDYFTVTNTRAAMSGDYLCLMYAPEGSWITDAYFGRSPVTVTVSHKYVDTVTPPTCTAQGYTTHKCSVCGNTVKDTYTEKLTHDYVATVTPPTCTAEGYTTHKCSLCGDTYTDTPTAKAAHKYTSKVTKAATCTATGVRTYTCSVCGDSYTKTISKAAHKYVDTVTPPTCTALGYTTHKCSVCGNTVKDTYTEKLTHDYVATVTLPTCTAEGYTTHKCSLCGDTYTDTPTAKAAHKYTSKVTKAATCTATGVRTYTCSVCGDSYTKTISKAAHKYVDTVTPPTCTAQGYTTHKCSVCGNTVKDTYTAMTAHKYVDSLVAPTLEAEGYTLHKCSVCGTSYTDTAVPRLKNIADADISLKYTAITYSASGINADKYLTIVYGDRELVRGEDYETAYEGSKEVGYKSCTLTITGLGEFGGTVEKKLTVKPAALAAPKLSTKDSSIIVSWNRTTTDALAYQVIYDRTPNFDTSAANHTEEYHTTTVTDLDTLTKTLSAYTKPGETWYVRVRAFITSDGTVNGTRYGTFSKAASITVKGNVGSASIPYGSYAYSGKAIEPVVTVKDSKGNKLSADDYTFSYSNNTKVGKATIKITGKGSYQGSITKTFVVKPANNTISALTSTKQNSFTVSYKKATAGASGYQIIYCKNSSFASSDPTYHSTTVTSLDTLSKTVSSNVKSGETWYVKVRSFVTINGTRYGNYSAAKSVKIK